MEMIIGCIFLTVLLLILLIFCKKVTFSIEIKYPENTYINIEDLYDTKGNPIDKEVKATIDDALAAVNSIMLDTEVKNNE